MGIAKKERLLIIMGVLVLAFGLLFIVKKGRGPSVNQSLGTMDFNPDEQVIAFYDRLSDPSKHNPLPLPHICISLDKYADKSFFQKLSDTLVLKERAMITIRLLTANDNNVLPEVTDGEFDDVFKLLCESVKSHGNNVLLRWNPEMEVPVKTHSWQYRSAAEYIAAFRYFSAFCKQISKDTRIVWGPAGYPGTEEYWPGNDATDLVSITLDNQSEKMLSAYPPYPDLETEVRRKIHRLRFMDKPVCILGPGKLKPEASSQGRISEVLAGIKKEELPVYSAVSRQGAGVEASGSRPVIGVYDPKLLLVSSASVKAEHIFIDLTHVQNGSFKTEFDAIVSRGHDAIVSFEPWRDQKARKDTNVLLNTINGVYDEEFNELYRIIGATSQKVYLRFAHEMEIPIHRYAWQSQDPILYIKAFRYFMNFGKGRGTNVRRVWGPAGDRGSLEWWPGADVVDYISVAIYGLPDKNITDPKMQESFGSIFYRKLHRIRLAGKPVFITEFGVKGPEDYKQQWLSDAAEVINKHREISGISYFNLADNPEVWGNMPAPDWSLKRETFDEFVKELSERR